MNIKETIRKELKMTKNKKMTKSRRPTERPSKTKLTTRYNLLDHSYKMVGKPKKRGKS